MGKTSSSVKRRYNVKAYDQMQISVPKGERERYKAFAAAHGESLAGLVKRLLDAELARADIGERSGSDEQPFPVE